MFNRITVLCYAIAIAMFATLSLTGFAYSRDTPAVARNGVVKVKSVHDFTTTIDLLKKDIAAKGIKFFAAIDQSQLGAEAGIKLQPSTLLVFGNPPLGIQFLTANPDSRARLACAVARDRRRRWPGLGGVYGFRLDRAPPRHQQSQGPVQNGERGHRLDHDARLAVIAREVRKCNCRAGPSWDRLLRWGAGSAIARRFILRGVRRVRCAQFR